MSVSVVYPNKDFIYLYARLNWTNIKQDSLSSFLTKVSHYFYKVLISNCIFEITTTETQTRLQLSHQKFGSYLLMDTNKKIPVKKKPPQTHISFIMPRPKGIGSCIKSGTGNNQGRQQTNPCYDLCFNRNYSHSKINKLSLTVISIYPTLNNSVINPSLMSSVCQQPSISSHFTPDDNQWFNIKGSN